MRGWEATAKPAPSSLAPIQLLHHRPEARQSAARRLTPTHLVQPLRLGQHLSNGNHPAGREERTGARGEKYKWARGGGVEQRAGAAHSSPLHLGPAGWVGVGGGGEVVPACARAWKELQRAAPAGPTTGARAHWLRPRPHESSLLQRAAAHRPLQAPTCRRSGGACAGTWGSCRRRRASLPPPSFQTLRPWLHVREGRAGGGGGGGGGGGRRRRETEQAGFGWEAAKEGGLQRGARKVGSAEGDAARPGAGAGRAQEAAGGGRRAGGVVLRQLPGRSTHPRGRSKLEP